MIHHQVSRTAAILIIFMGIQITQISSDAQSHRQSARRNESRASTEFAYSSDSSTGGICENLSQDSLGTVPIDEMAAREPLPITDRRVLAGRQRAERLLRVAKKLLPAALKRLTRIYDEDISNLTAITARVSAINTIKPDVEAHDNALVGARDPHAITFGTVFLAGLRSDEAMLAVLAHELSHVADGRDHVLQNLFSRIRQHASNLGGISIHPFQGIELGCDLVGVYVLQDYIARTDSKEPKSLRMARAFQKNCVTDDIADATHLSPRTTLRLLLMLEPNVLSLRGGEDSASSNQQQKVSDRGAPKTNGQRTSGNNKRIRLFE